MFWNNLEHLEQEWQVLKKSGNDQLHSTGKKSHPTEEHLARALDEILRLQRSEHLEMSRLTYLELSFLKCSQINKHIL